MITLGTLHLVQGVSQQDLLDAYHDGHGFTLKNQLVKHAAKAAGGSTSAFAMMSQPEGKCVVNAIDV